MAAALTADLEQLKALVQAIDPPTRLEHLTAALIGELIGVSVAVAKSGFQHGADAGTAGRQERFLRIECKRYRDDTSLNDRLLLGEIDQAIFADPALEAWILAATREADEQLERQLFKHGNGYGIAVLIVDWKSHDEPALAALLASNAALVSKLLDPVAGALAARLAVPLGAAIERMRRDLAAWHIGTAVVRRQSFARLRSIWTDPRQSQSHFGQVVSGGAKRHIHRVQVLRQLDEWWSAHADTASPACVTGLFGVGKTWAVTNWLIERVNDLPATLLIPASAVGGRDLGSVYEVKSFLAERLLEVMQVRDAPYWRARLERMLLRPPAEGPVLLLILDGMSQQPQANWEGLLKILQGAEFVGRVRTITTTRTLHFEVKLRRLASLVDRAVSFEVEGYDLEPSGEFDQMLTLIGLRRADLHPDLYTTARIPRLFDLVIRFRERLVEAGAVTLHRLLWEYGSDTAGASANKAFSAPEWAEWLCAAAAGFQDGIRSYSLKALSDSAARSDLAPGEIYQRLSELADSAFFTRLSDGTLKLTPSLVNHALGATAVQLLSADPHATRESLESALEQWLDPISGLDQRPEILRAAVSIALESGPPRPLLGVLAAAWLQTQNLAENHQVEVQALAAEMPDALLDAIELSHRYNHAASRHTAVEALRGIHRSNTTVRARIFARAAQWLRRISREVEARSISAPEAEAEAHRQNRWIERIGIDASGPRKLLGEEMVLVDRDEGQWTDHLPALVEGYPLVEAVPALRLAAVAAAVGSNHRAWDQLRWVYLFNPVDPNPVAASVRAAAADMAARTPETGVHPQLARRVAELMLLVSGLEEDSEAAAELNVVMGRPFTYEEHYLADPGRSLFFRLERRHVLAVLVDETLPLHVRLKKCDDLWFDPGFEPPVAFCQAVADAAREFPLDKMHTGGYSTREDHSFDELQTVLARCAPEVLADLHRRLASRVPTTAGARVARAWHQTDALLLHGPEQVAAARTLRTVERDAREGEEAHAATRLLLTELTDLDALAQALLVVEADLPFIPTMITDDLLPMSSAQVDQLIGRCRFGSSKQQQDVLVLLITAPPTLSDAAWDWLVKKANSTDEIDVRLAFMALAAADSRRLGVHLDQAGWRFTPNVDTLAAHAASGALIEATRGQPFKQIAGRMAPWRLLEAVRLRGSDASEARVALQRLDAILAGGPREPPDPGAQVFVERTDASNRRPWYSTRPMPPEDPNSAEAFEHEFDEKAQQEAHERASETANERIAKARKEGASLYLEFVTREDGQAILQHGPDLLARWIDGHDSLSAEFVRRVQFAEGLFLAIAEALLIEQPSRGVSVWRALGHAMRTRVMGAAKLPELLHMLFRVPASFEVIAARDALLELGRTNTDAQLYELALAAQLNGCTSWLEAVIARDLVSHVPWRQQRAETLRGFLTGNVLPVADAWPEGPSRSRVQEIRRGAARLRYLEACAHHWWREYWRRDDPEGAFSAWVLFEKCADRRAVCWMRQEAETSTLDEAQRARKRRHWALNRPRWNCGADKSGLALQRTFLRRHTDGMVWPWRE
ncbi:hypothetical protein C1929_19795 [Stenotrophomonas sp. ZAC14D1_NAIMI4_6]|uniref:hypothetical protein n=1 Tax=unclassified Stenotrophomonas maltophilia group TaxID=2961925 RepID=UPI000D53DB09|nr:MULTISPECIES: hypothetical protein [unclassified Stenotrophomonas maltophilia group]AWH38860.1 hypothetical protein C1929_19795 [Stenotrophomonas sp. ZAC14D1_NAIMI4_6]AWH42991.1 hypothetical protein C1927_19795 [Stenotrophomonas sp. ZAC14D1_NAIMI4_1]